MNWDKWTKEILKEQELNWKVKTSKIKGDGLTIFKTKEIICTKEHYALFLHEIAHAILGKNHTMKKNHDAIWADIFTKLCKDYLTPKDKASRIKKL